MALMSVLPGDTEAWTVAELDAFVAERGDDGLSYELLDGLLLVSPARVPMHQRAVARIFSLVQGACPPGAEVMFAPLDWRPDDRTSLQPDVLAFRNEAVGELNITGGLLLAVEVLSPSTRRKDLVLKFAKYRDSGVTSYWIVDPKVPSVVAYRLTTEGYVEVGRAEGAEELQVEGDFAISFRPADLVSPPA